MKALQVITKFMNSHSRSTGLVVQADPKDGPLVFRQDDAEMDIPDQDPKRMRCHGPSDKQMHEEPSRSCSMGRSPLRVPPLKRTPSQQDLLACDDDEFSSKLLEWKEELADFTGWPGEAID